MIKTVIFDMDGVIVDTEPVHHFAYNQLFKQLQIEISPELYASFTGNSTKNIFEKLKAEFDLPHDVETLVNWKRELFNEAFDHKEDLFIRRGGTLNSRLTCQWHATHISIVFGNGYY
jgi:beta-phosphoglucomutase-like phosphatase (HAD superfamily)